MLLMDTDFHRIENKDGQIINPPKAIVIEDRVWVGCRATILKGSHIGKSNVVVSGSVLTKNIQTHIQ